MSSEPPKLPFLDSIKNQTETSTAWLQWVAKLIVHRNWVSLLMLVDVVGLFLFKPKGGLVSEALNLPPWYPIAFWLTFASIFIAALIIAVRNYCREQPTPPEPTPPEWTAIKGLRAFTSKDAEIFKRLQRESDLNRCVESIANGDFRFGILMGLSGCGKTSFLRAGLLPRLKEPGYNLRGVYVRFSDEEPLKTIRKAIAKALEIPLDWLEGDFLQLVTKAVEAARSPVVLFLDQFEQWFVHYKGVEERKPLLQGLKEWYNEEVGNVKIVVSIRSDLYYRLNEVQQCLGYNLGPQDVFELKKFSPQQATQVLKAIAETEQLGFDEGFLAKLTKEELADKEDGLISPVDLQILAWMITAQNTSELRAFNGNAFQKFGGVEELLSRYLQEVLLAQTMKTRREAAVKVLLALIDLEQQVRSGVLTLEELAAKNPHVQSQEIKAAVKWLERGDVRLITPVEKDNSMGYELAHERLIGAVMKQANQELTNVSRANQLLERRVNEWLGNNRSHRYLLPWWELRFIEKNKSHWGSKREKKQHLLARSRRRIYRFASVFIVFALMVVSFTGWLQFTPQGQIYRVYWSITNPWDKHFRNIDDDPAAEVAVAIANYGKWEYAFQLVREHIESDGAKESFLREFSKVVPLQHNTNQAETQLKEALALAKEIEDSYF